MQPPKYLPSYGRRKGRKLTPARLSLMEDHQHIFAKNTDELSGFINLGKPLWLEIGFGSGEHLAEQAIKNPDINFIGAETFLDGCGALVKKIAENKLTNIRIFNNDARDLLLALPAASIARTFVLFPDPWPKKRHNKKRIINQETLDMLAVTMKKNGRLRLATDHQDYAQWMLVQIFANKNFHWLSKKTNDWLQEPDDHFQTRYQQKSLAGNIYYFIDCERV